MECNNYKAVANSNVPSSNITYQAVEDVADPEEDDLDHLDDMLDEFTGTKICKTPRPSRKPSIPPLSNQYEDTAAEATTEDFSKLLQDQMAALMGSIDESPDMKNKVEHMIKDLGAAADAERSSESISHAKDAVQMGAESLSKEEPFQETIRKTMERMQVSGEQAGAARQTEHSDEMLAKMLKDMQSSGLSDETGDEGFNKMLLGMMEQLTNKEILYEPMKELHNKFPGWLQKNRASINSADLKRYEEQQTLVAEIVARFEGKEYSDSNPEDREFIVDRMQQMQAAGSPPADLVGNMSAAQDILDGEDPSCPQQ